MDKEFMYLYGAGGHAKVIMEIIKSYNIQIKGIFDDNIYIRPLCGFQINKGIKISKKGTFPKLELPLIISIGDNERRAEIAKLLDVAYGKAIHSSAIISNNELIEDGTVVLQGAILQNDVSIGKHVLINTAARICNGARIENYAHVSPHSVVSENAVIGEGTHVGAGAVINPNVTVGKWCKIGAGSIVLQDIPDRCTVVGNPMKIIKNTIVFA
ncbi:MAG: sugar O-acyltransferase, sialic acid O-acetyltransferase NeuD family [Sphingobacteriales bacterium]|nr:sugar O-acyltransferase, sialic acid O-acetyltransferase NeuD family [Sphingobacteriales bacterium]